MMNNEERILGLLEQLAGDVALVKIGQRETNERMDRVEGKVDALDAKVDALDAKVNTLDAKANTLDVKVDAIKKDTEIITDQTAHLTEFKTETTQKVESVLIVTKDNTFDIAKMKAILARAGAY